MSNSAITTRYTHFYSLFKLDLQLEDFWTGGAKVANDFLAGIYYWSAYGEPVTYNKWVVGEPNGSGYCIYLSGASNLEFADDRCDQLKNVICNKVVYTPASGDHCD